MAGIKISALTALPSTQATDVAPWVQGGTTYKGSVSQLQTFFQTNLSFLALSGGTMTGAINMGSHQINALTDPTLAQDAATKAYVDATAQGLTIQGACRVATTTALTVTYNNVSVSPSGVGATLTNAGAQAAIVIDGVTLVLNDRVLVKNQASALQNGIYTVTALGSGATNWVMTRATDYNIPAQINPGDLVVITAGTLNANSSWLQTATVSSVGVSSITFTQFSASLPITVPNGGTGLTTTTAYGVIMGGTTATGAFQNAGTGQSGTIFQGNGSAALPTWSTATYPSVATGTGTILRADGTNWTPTTTTYPNTNAINTIMYASSANVLGVITSANSSIMVSGVSGIPAWSTTLPAFITSSITFSPTTGGIVGTTTNDNAAAGKVGELISNVILFGSAISISSNTATNVTSISLTAGDWDVWGNVRIDTSAGMSEGDAWVSSTSATLPDGALRSTIGLVASLASPVSLTAPMLRFSLSGTTTIYLGGYTTFTGTGTVCGGIYARRRR